MENEQISVQLLASDSDADPDDELQFSITSNTEDVSLTSSGVLTWRPANGSLATNDETKIDLALYDGCVTSDWEITLMVMDCPCEGDNNLCHPSNTDAQGKIMAIV